MFFTRKPAPPRRQVHSLTLKAWPPEIKGDGLGIVGVIFIILIVVLASAFGVPVAKNLADALSRSAQAIVLPAERPPPGPPV